MKSARGDRGQALLELLFCAALVFSAVSGAGALLRSQWDRWQCANRVFEAVHARVSEIPFAGVFSGVIIEEDEHRVRGHAVCGQAHETVSLPRLESARW